MHIVLSLLCLVPVHNRMSGLVITAIGLSARVLAPQTTSSMTNTARVVTSLATMDTARVVTSLTASIGMETSLSSGAGMETSLSTSAGIVTSLAASRLTNAASITARTSRLTNATAIMTRIGAPQQSRLDVDRAVTIQRSG